MSLLSDYRVRIKSLLAADDVQKALELEGVSAVGARAIGVSRAVIAQRSILRKELVKAKFEDDEPAQGGKEPANEEEK